MRRAICFLLLLPSCSPGGPGQTGFLSLDPSATDGTYATSEPGTTGDESTGAPVDETTEAPPPARTCEHWADGFMDPPLELDVKAGSKQRLEFTVQGLPDPALIEQAELRFISHDADNPFSEGRLYVNGGPSMILPAELAWSDADHYTAVDVTGQTRAGANDIAFGAGSAAWGTFYRISAVSLVVTARGAPPCPEGPLAPSPRAHEVDFQDAVYTDRHNWVLRCAFDPPYAFTAEGHDHAGEDCAGLYDPDGSTHGTATFLFPAVEPAIYEVRVFSRHSTNRNPLGALFVVDGEPRRVFQNDEAGFITDVWGLKVLSGDIEVVLDSTREFASDSVISVQLRPR